MKGGSLNKTLNSVCQSKILLYVLAVFAFFVLIDYLSKNNLAAIALFLIIGVSTTHYTKNMILVILASLIGTKILINLGFLHGLGFREGLENKDKNKKAEIDTVIKDAVEKKVADKGYDAIKKQSEFDADIDAIKNAGCKKEGKTYDAHLKKCVAPQGSESERAAALELVTVTETSDTKPKDTTKPKVKKTGFSNLDDDDDLTGSGTKVNYAKTVENAFDSLEKILGSDGIKRMTQDTSRLADKQQSLISAMKNMEPMIEKAQGMMNSLQGGMFEKLLGNNEE